MKIFNLMWLVMILTVLNGCAQSSSLIKTSSTSVRNDVFQELTNASPVPQESADLHITATLKTHKPGVYSAKDPHGTPDYTLLVNVDGQVAVLRGTLQNEADGIRYSFSKDLRLKGGIHSIVVALPGDRIAVKKEITLLNGEVNNLVLEPVYGSVSEKKRPSSTKVTGFEEGIRGISLTLDGRDL